MEGLNKQEIDYRISNNLINNENIKHSRTLKQIFLSNIITLFNIINIILFVLVLTTGSVKNATFVFSIFVNTVISIYQEIKAKRIIDKLKITTTDKITVVREGKKIEILPSEILLDDLLYLRQGESIPVDAKIVKSDSLEVDESIITGESNSINKKKDEMLISGSIITAGSCYARVSSINNSTYANNLIKEASKNNDSTSYLMKNINSILKVVTVLIVPTGILLFITQFIYSGQTYKESVLSSVAGVIGMIPDGLVLLTSVSLTVGVIKMASKKVIIQRLCGIELLACVDVLCLDKTGTITDGSLEVVDFLNTTKKDYSNILANIAVPDGNFTDKAILKYFKKEKEEKIIKRVPFSSQRKYSYTQFDNDSYALGALEFITDDELSDYDELNQYIEKGYRILTLVKCKNNNFDKLTNEVVSFIILKDNVRKNAKETLEYFKKQNVDVKIISGDNPLTVSNILRQLDIDNYDKYISGTDLSDDYDEIKKIVNNYTIFGRVTPYQKRLIIKALKETSTVGYIGDGVNDILALKEADCGIALAMGISAARSVSEVVLTESDFQVLPKIVDEGRRVVNNIERVASMYFIKTIYSFMIAILCIILNHEYPFYPIQLTLISVVCVGVPSFFLAIEPNYTKVKKGFLLKVFRNALPSGLCVFINISFIIMFTYIFKLDFEIYRLTVVAATGFLNLRLLYNVSKPLTLLRKILLIFCSVTFYLLLFMYREFFQIPSFSFITILFTIIVIFADMYITDFLEGIYDKLANIYLRRNKYNN